MKSSSPQLRQAALLIASLDPITADALLDQLSPGEADLVRRMVVSLDNIDVAEQEAAISEFLGIDDAPPPPEPSPAPVARHEPPFQFLHEADCKQLLRLVEMEHPQTVAVIVSYLPPERAAELLFDLTPALQADVMRRLVDLEEADPVVLREVEQWLQERIARNVRSDHRRAAGLAALVDILGMADGRLQGQLQANLSRHAPELARLLPATPGIQCFDDLWLLDRTSLRRLLDEADPQATILALAGARHSVVEWLLRQLPEHEAQDLRLAWRRLGPTSLNDIEQAQEELVQLACALGLTPDDQQAALV